MPPVTLVHGLGCSHRYFRRLWPLLPGAQCPDLLGDTVESLADELDAVAPEGVVLVGNSLGCETAVELASRRPGRVAALVLIGSTVDAQRRRFVPQLATLAADAVREPLPLLLLLLHDYARWGLPRLLRTAASMLSDPVERKVPGLDVPVLVIRGERDPICPEAWAETLASAAPRGRLLVVPGAAHAVHWTHADVVARAVEELAQELGEG